MITSAVINTLSHIAKQGSGNEHKIAFIGQDLYPVFSNYSYICEFEMMGCAQIQPLMYFQLMNVPMWRGTYMIFNVTHTMTPGNMVTRVKAMKLSNRAIPYSNAWFTKNLSYKGENADGTASKCETELGTTGSGEASYEYSQYKDKVNREGRQKHIDMDKVLRGVTTYVRKGKTWNVGTASRGHCATAVQTWYSRGTNGKVVIHFWGNRSDPWVENLSVDLTKYGFKLVHSSGDVDISNKKQALQEQRKTGNFAGLQLGDVMVIIGRYGNGSPTGHVAMWTGKDWRSDFAQPSAGVESGLRKSGNAKGSVQIWRFDDAIYEKYH